MTVEMNIDGNQQPSWGMKEKILSLNREEFKGAGCPRENRIGRTTTTTGGKGRLGEGQALEGDKKNRDDKEGDG